MSKKKKLGRPRQREYKTRSPVTANIRRSIAPGQAKLLAKKMKVSNATAYRWITGQSIPDAEQYVKIIDFLNKENAN